MRSHDSGDRLHAPVRTSRLFHKTVERISFIILRKMIMPMPSNINAWTVHLAKLFCCVCDLIPLPSGNHPHRQDGGSERRWIDTTHTRPHCSSISDNVIGDTLTTGSITGETVRHTPRDEPLPARYQSQATDSIPMSTTLPAEYTKETNQIWNVPRTPHTTYHTRATVYKDKHSS